MVLSIQDRVFKTVAEFNKKHRFMIVIVKQEVFGIVLCMDHKLAHTRTNVMFLYDELKEFKEKGKLEKLITDVLNEMEDVLIKAQKVKR